MKLTLKRVLFLAVMLLLVGASLFLTRPVDPYEEEFIYLKSGELCLTWIDSYNRTRMAIDVLKYADELKMDDFRVEIDIKELRGRSVIYDITNLENYTTGRNNDTVLLRYIDGAWYKAGSQIPFEFVFDLSKQYDDTELSPSITEERYKCMVFRPKGGAGSTDENGIRRWRHYTIPSGRYGLFYGSILAEVEDGKLVAHGGGLVMFDYVNNDGAGSHAVECTYDAIRDFCYSGSGRIKNISETLYHDPYA